METYTWTIYYTYVKSGKSQQKVSVINAPTIGRAFQILRKKMLKNPDEEIKNICAKRSKIKEN